jgi:hypothetical protein
MMCQIKRLLGKHEYRWDNDIKIGTYVLTVDPSNFTTMLSAILALSIV